MRSLSLRFLLLSVVTFVSSSVLAHDVTLSGTQNFSALDGSAVDHDGVANGVFTVDDGNLVVNGPVNCNDGVGFPQSPCPMTFSVSGNMTVNAGGALSAEDRIANGTAASITLNVGGNLVLGSQSGSTPGALISTAALVASNASGGNVTANVDGSITMGKGATFDASSYKANAGNIAFTAGGQISVDGNVLSGPSRTFTGSITGIILSGAVPLQKGGQISITSSTFAEPALVVGTNAAIVSQGENPGAGPVTLDACGIEIRGLVASMGRNNTTTKVVVRSGKNVLIDASDLGVSGATLGRVARLRADSTFLGSAVNRAVEVFARGSVSILGPAAGSSTRYALSSNASGVSPNTKAGTIRVMALEGTLTATGRIADASQDFVGGQGGVVDLAAAGDIDLTAGHIRAIGNYTIPSPGRKGGTINARSYSGDIVWINGSGDVRPTGSESGIPPADQGKISLTACGTVGTTGTSFPTNGAPTGAFPTTATGVCSPAAPSLPSGVVLVTCNTPPVANDTSASTNEDTTVTITLSGSDVDGDSLTFTIVSGPSNGSLGPIISTGPTTATVDYTPDPDYNGGDSFVFQANDGNGGTNNATASITIAPVNDPPTFLAGPTVNVLEDSGPQTIPGWVTSISPGPPDESAQVVTFTVTNDNNALFAVQPAVDSTGTLTFTPAANQFGSATITIVAQDNGGTANGGDDTSNAQTSTINVNGVNDEPSFVAGPSQTVNEDAGPQTVAGWATSISAGPNEGGQTLTFVTSNDNNALFSAQPSVASNGTLTYTPAANANGSATVTVFLTDDGGTANGGDDTAPSQTFTITVNAVNDEPSFTSGGDVTVLEDSGAYSAAWATGISAGPADESGQTVTFNTSNDNNALFSAQPSVASDGTLSFTVAANQFGAATVTIFAQDNGGTANGGDDTSPSQTFVINVTPVNDEPSFTPGGNVTVNEDSGAYSASWATAISAGPNEGSQTVAFNVSNDNNALFSAQPSISPTGVLTFTPAADANGTATVSVFLTDDGGTANGGDDTSATVTFTISVNAVNDEPSFTSGGDVTVLEDSGAYSASWATGISAGPADESGQTVTFNTSNDNNALFSVQPAVASDGTLTFTVAANQYGSATVTIFAQDNGGTANGGDDTSPSQTFVINVTPVNDEPSFTPGGNVTVNEDSGAYSASWATAISAGPNEGSQNVTFNVSNDNNALFSAQPSISPTGLLTFTPAADANGSATVSVFLTDDGGTANGGDDTSATVTFTITVNAVNDEPTFTSGGNVSVLEDSGSYSAQWATGVSAGPADESAQNLTFFVSNDNNGLFSAQPAISPSGVLTFTVAPDAFGMATVSVYLMDSGGTANGGDDTSPTVTFTINVDSVNDAPSFVAGGDVTVNEDNGPYSAMWASSISAGPANEAGQTLNFNVSNDNNALFSAQPSIAPNGVLTFTPAANAFGSAIVTVSLSDNGGTTNGGVDTSPSVTFNITVNSINDPPTAGADSWATFGNTEIRVDLGPGTTPHVVATTGSGTGVLDNDADNVEGDPFSITSVVACGDTTAPFDCTFGDGSVLSLNANGSFTFTPGPGATTASFQYVVTDSPSSGIPASATGTVTFTVNEMIWYVNGSVAPGGNGTSIAPFKDFASLNGLGDVDGPNAYIFVHNSVVNGSIALETNQRLLGEGVGLTVNSYTLVPAGTRPTVNSAADTVTVTGVTGVEIAGLTLNSAGGNGIDVTSLAVAPASASIHDNVVSGAGAEGIDVTASNATPTIVTIAATSITANGHGLDVTAAAPAVISYTNGTVLSVTGSGVVMTGSGNLTVSGLSNVVIDGNTAGNGITISGATFDAVPGGAFNTVSGGSIAVGASGNPVGGAGVTLTTVSGDYAIGSLTVFAGTSGVTIEGTGLFAGSSGMRVTNGGGSINAPAGVGLRVANATIGSSNLNFGSVSAAGGANGIFLDTTGSVGGLVINGDGADVSVGGNNTGGTIQNTSGPNGSTSGVGVYLRDSRATLRRMHIHDHTNYGVFGTGSVVFGLEYSTVDSTAGPASTIGDSSASDDEEGSLAFEEWSGSGTLTNCVIADGYQNNLRILNASGADLNRLTVTNSVFENNGLTGNNNIHLESRNPGSTLNFTLQGSTVKGARADWMNASANSGSAMDVVVDGNAFSNLGLDAHATPAPGGNRLTLGSIGTLTYDILDNSLQGSLGEAIRVRSSGSLASLIAGTAEGTIDGNDVGIQAIANSGSTQSSGIFLLTDGGGDHTARVSNNNVYQYNSHGIRIDVGDEQVGTSIVAMTITNNVVSTPGNLNSDFNGIHLNHGTVAATDDFTSCINISGNIVTGSGSGAVYPSNAEIRLRQRQATTVILPGYSGANNEDCNVIAFIGATNIVSASGAGSCVNGMPNPPTVNVAASTQGATTTTRGFESGASCTLPN